MANFIKSPFGTWVNAANIQGVRVEKQGRKYATIIYSDIEDFIFAYDATRDEATARASSLMEKIGHITYSDED